MENAHSRYGLGAWLALLVAAGLQTFIDRRFYRRKYDAEQVLTTFASTPRDEVDRTGSGVRW